MGLEENGLGLLPGTDSPSSGEGTSPSWDRLMAGCTGGWPNQLGHCKQKGNFIQTLSYPRQSQLLPREDTLAGRRGEPVLPAARGHCRSKGHEVVGAAVCQPGCVSRACVRLLLFRHPTALTPSSETCTCKSVRQSRGGGKQKPSQGSRD